MSNAVINVIPKPITSGRTSKGKRRTSPARLSLLYSIHLTVFQLDYLVRWNGRTHIGNLLKETLQCDCQSYPTSENALWNESCLILCSRDCFSFLSFCKDSAKFPIALCFHLMPFYNCLSQDLGCCSRSHSTISRLLPSFSRPTCCSCLSKTVQRTTSADTYATSTFVCKYLSHHVMITPSFTHTTGCGGGWHCARDVWC